MILVMKVNQILAVMTTKRINLAMTAVRSLSMSLAKNPKKNTKKKHSDQVMAEGTSLPGNLAILVVQISTRLPTDSRSSWKLRKIGLKPSSSSIASRIRTWTNSLTPL